MKRITHILVLIALALLTLGADIDRARFERVGHELICTCGCNQVLLECNHVGCQVSEGMRKQIIAGLEQGSGNDAILQSFVDQFGPTVLAAPTKTGFNRTAWIMPFAVFAVALGVAVYFVRKWSMRLRTPVAAPAGVPARVFDELREQARKETEL